MMPPFPAGTPIYPVMRPVKMEAGSDWSVLNLIALYILCMSVCCILGCC
jgi:hypothetical protein